MNIQQVGEDLGQLCLKNAKALTRALGVQYIQCPGSDSPSTLEDLKAHLIECVRDKGFFRVSKDNCEDTIYGSGEANVAFRFWHDMVHIQLDLGMNLRHELMIGEAHVNAVKWVGLSTDHQLLMWIDTCGQSLYNAIAGEFPQNQMRFTEMMVRYIDKGHTPAAAAQAIANQGAL